MKALKSVLALTTMMMFNPVQAANELEVVAEMKGTRPGNITVTPAGRTILSMQPLDAPELRVVELMADGSTKPFPTLDWADGPEKGEVGIASIIGVDTTADGVVWMLDMGSADSPAQMIAWDSVNNKLVRVYPIDKSAMAANSFLQDFAIDTKRNKIYIADTTLGNLAGDTKPAFVVLDLTTGESRRVLEASETLMPPEHILTTNGSVMGAKREDGSKEAIFLGLNPITIDNDSEWVYYGTVNGDKIHRIPAAKLADDKATSQQLLTSIEYFSDKRPSDGMIISPKGNIYVGDAEKSALGVANKEGYKTLVQDDKLLAWADGFAIHDGWLYITQNQLNMNPALNEGEESATKPYHILRMKLAE